MDTPTGETKIKEAPELVEFDVQSLNDLVVRKWYEDKTSQAKKMPDNIRALAPEGAIPIQDLEDLFEAFNHIDEDGSGEIDASELSQKLSELGQGFSLLELRKLINSVDQQVGGDDKISFVEFCRAYRKKNHDAQKDRSFEDTIKKLFASYDRDKSGSLELYEVMRLLYKLPLFGIQRDIEKLKVLAQEFIDACEGGSEKDGKIHRRILCSIQQSVRRSWRKTDQNFVYLVEICFRLGCCHQSPKGVERNCRGCQSHICFLHSTC